MSANPYSFTGSRTQRPSVRAARTTHWLVQLASWLPAALLAFAVPTALSGCGDESGETTGPAPPKIARVKPGGRRASRGPAKGGNLSFYKKVEEFAADDEEKERLRHTFDLQDFEPDSTGLENRDPFRSYVIRQPGEGPQNATEPEAKNEDSECRKGHVAPEYPLRDLTLVGIVLRGTKSYALFRDSASYGHIVNKGDCLGQEKARVTAIRTGFVNLQVTPEASPNQQDRAPQQKAIQLYPDEMLPDIAER